MKKLLLSLLSISLTISAFAQNEDLPNTRMKDLATNKPIAFNEAIEPGKVTLISFWATWCVPCITEIKTFKKKLPEWQKEVDFNYITISMDETSREAMARNYVKSNGWKFPCYIDVNSDLMRSVGFSNIPFTAIVDKKGKIVYTHTSFQLGGEKDVFEKIKKYDKE